MTFVFRNNTIERFFPEDYTFSGYSDISVIPQADQYVWWYQLPMHMDGASAQAEVESYLSMLQMVIAQIGDKPLLLFTMDILYNAQSTLHLPPYTQAVDNYNAEVMRLCESRSHLKLVDVRTFYHNYTHADLIDWKFYFLSQMGLNPRLSTDFKQWYQHQLDAIALKRKKCLVLDLDNTLWGGVLGEDGVEGIQLSGDYPGKAFHWWQEALLELKKQGIILCICSKNNPEDVEQLWQRRHDMVLHQDDFSAVRINWQDKATNIQELAQELNIGLDAMVFVDDNPTERELIRQALPMVAVPDWAQQPYELPNLYQRLVADYFRVYSVTDEDRNKTEQYRQNAQRAQARALFTNMEDYLRSLEMHLTIERLSPSDGAKITRAAQMTQKTNQFNLTTHRYTEEDIRELILSGQVWILSVRDKFGDNGISGLMIITTNDEIDTMLMSCRVLGKGIEEAFVNTVLKYLQQDGRNRMIANYIPSDKNGQVKDFWVKMGFSAISGNDMGGTIYMLDLPHAELTIKDYYNIG